MYAALLALLPLVAATSYPMVESWSGDSFLDGFNCDPSTYDNTTNGDVFWTRPDNTSLVYTSDTGTMILKVDNTTDVVYNQKRYAPKLLSRTAYAQGTVWVIDSLHLPYGCSVWPSFWTQGPDWPAGGEIDIMEGVNNQTTNQIAVHASDTGCTASSSANMTGTLTEDQCSYNVSDNSGCTIDDTATNSYGAGFAAAGGGVYISELSDEGVRVWFFTRSAVPSAITVDAETIDTSILGTPVAFYPTASCDSETYFGAQTLTIDITLCGDWAGTASVLEETCPALVGDLTCYTTYVINDAGTTYDNAYFEFNYINIYSSATAEAPALAGIAASSGGSANATATSSTDTTSSASSTSSSSGAGRAAAFGGMPWAGLAALGFAAGVGACL